MFRGLKNPVTVGHVPVVFRIVKALYEAFFKKDSKGTAA